MKAEPQVDSPELSVDSLPKLKIAALKKLERAAFTMLEVANEECKKNPSANALRIQLNNTWNIFYTVLKREQNAWAAKRDKGEVLFTVFVPGKSYVRERIRTPNRVITHYLWKDSWPEPHYRASGEPSIEVLSDSFSRRFYPPEYHFKQFMKEAA